MSFTVAKNYDSLNDFEPWSGAVSIYEQIMNDERARDYVECYLDEACDPRYWDETMVNDFIWFDVEELLIEAGIWEEEK